MPSRRNDVPTKTEETFDGTPFASLSLTPYKRLGFYQLLDPNGPRVRGYHVFSSALKLYLLAVQCIAAFGILGYVAGTGDGRDDRVPVGSESFEVAIILTNCTLSSLKMYALVSNAKLIWSFFELARADFLRARPRHGGRVEAEFARRCGRSTAIAEWIARCFLAGMFLWFAGPLVAADGEPQHCNGRRQNVINVKFPVTVDAYNEYYLAFFIMEVAIGFCIVYGSILVDAFLMSFCWIISARYQSVAKLYETFGHDRRLSTTERTTRKNDGEIDLCDEFKSIIMDHQKVYSKMKSFYAVVRPITLIHVFAYSCSLIVYAYNIVKIFNPNESFNIAEIMKICMTISNVTIEVYIFCYLFELVDAKKDAVNFGLYSCNWTSMDIRFKKLLIMSMKMNNANRLKLKATPNITIDRSFFANVIHNCFKIVSVLKQTQSNNLQN